MSLVDRALIMGLALLYERESGYPWSITHRPTEAFQSCFPVEPLPSPNNRAEFLKAVQEMVQRGVKQWSTEMPAEKAVAERIRPPLEGLFGWHDFFSEDGSYNELAHSSVDQIVTESSTKKTCSTTLDEPIESTPNATTLGEEVKSPSESKSLSVSQMTQPSPSKSILKSGEQGQVTNPTREQGARTYFGLVFIVSNVDYCGFL